MALEKWQTAAQIWSQREGFMSAHVAEEAGLTLMNSQWEGFMAARVAEAKEAGLTPMKCHRCDWLHLWADYRRDLSEPRSPPLCRGAQDRAEVSEVFPEVFPLSGRGSPYGSLPL